MDRHTNTGSNTGKNSNNAPRGDKHAKRHRIFGDVSAIQVVATALAAVTSMLLASYIGIAGSVIGVAIASIVSTLAASLYKQFLSTSADKIKEIPVGEHRTLEDIIGKKPDGAPQDGGHAHKDDARNASAQGADAPARTADDAEVAKGADVAEGASVANGSANAAASIPLDELSIGGVALSADLGEEAADERVLRSGPSEPSTAFEGEDGISSAVRDASGIHGADNVHGERNIGAAHASGQSDLRRKAVYGLIAVCIISALLAVAATASIIYIATTGEGIGTKPQTIFVKTADDDAKDEHNDATDMSYTNVANDSTGKVQNSAAESTQNNTANPSAENGSQNTSQNAGDGNENAVNNTANNASNTTSNATSGNEAETNTQTGQDTPSQNT